MTLIPVICKLFELVLLEICEQFLSCDELQFGFKKGFDVQKQFLHCIVQLIILRIEVAPYLLPHWISQMHSIPLITTNYMLT